MNSPSLTYIIASRNDEFCGDSLKRLRITLDRIGKAHGLWDQKTIVVDWGSSTPLSAALGSKRMYNCPEFIYVPPRITSQYQTPFNEVLALNIGIRRATTPWIARLDQDILVGERFVEWFENHIKEDNSHPVYARDINAYFSERRDLLSDWTSFHNALEPSTANRWSDWPPSYPYFYRAAVGILLVSRIVWHQIRGYNESLTLRNHMEHDLCARLKKTCGLVNLGPLMDYDFYHQWHERVPNRKENPILSEAELDNVNLQVNNENWGMGDVEL